MQKAIIEEKPVLINLLKLYAYDFKKPHGCNIGDDGFCPEFTDTRNEDDGFNPSLA